MVTVKLNVMYGYNVAGTFNTLHGFYESCPLYEFCQLKGQNFLESTVGRLERSRNQFHPLLRGPGKERPGWWLTLGFGCPRSSGRTEAPPSHQITLTLIRHQTSTARTRVVASDCRMRNRAVSCRGIVLTMRAWSNFGLK